MVQKSNSYYQIKEQFDKMFTAGNPDYSRLQYEDRPNELSRLLSSIWNSLDCKAEFKHFKNKAPVEFGLTICISETFEYGIISSGTVWHYRYKISVNRVNEHGAWSAKIVKRNFMNMSYEKLINIGWSMYLSLYTDKLKYIKPESNGTNRI